jgi:hypothetical protein
MLLADLSGYPRVSTLFGRTKFHLLLEKVVDEISSPATARHICADGEFRSSSFSVQHRVQVTRAIILECVIPWFG